MASVQPCLRIVLLGPPGSGKSTQAERLASTIGADHISTGELLRRAVAEGTALGRRVAPVLSRGDYLPDDLITAIVRECLTGLGPDAGFVLDGYPRTQAQAEALDRLGQDEACPLHAVVWLEVARGELLDRLRGRGDSEDRPDDDLATVSHRLELDAELTEPLKSYYRRAGLLADVDGSGTTGEITDRILGALGAVSR